MRFFLPPSFFIDCHTDAAHGQISSSSSPLTTAPRRSLFIPFSLFFFLRVFRDARDRVGVIASPLFSPSTAVRQYLNRQFRLFFLPLPFALQRRLITDWTRTFPPSPLFPSPLSRLHEGDISASRRVFSLRCHTSGTESLAKFFVGRSTSANATCFFQGPN